MALGIPPRADAALPDVTVLPGVVAARLADARLLPFRRQRRKPTVRRVHQHRRPVGPGPPLHPEVVVGADAAPGLSAPGRRVQKLLVPFGRRLPDGGDLLVAQRLPPLELCRPLHRSGARRAPDALDVGVPPRRRGSLPARRVARRLGRRRLGRQDRDGQRHERYREKTQPSTHLEPPSGAGTRPAVRPRFLLARSIQAFGAGRRRPPLRAAAGRPGAPPPRRSRARSTAAQHGQDQRDVGAVRCAVFLPARGACRRRASGERVAVFLGGSGEPPGNRTPNPQIKSLLLCQLS